VPDLDELPILRELRDDLAAAFIRETPPARRPRWRWLLPAGGLCAAGAAAAALALTSGLDEGQVAPPPATAAALLRQAAGVALARPSELPAPDEFFYVHSLATNLTQNEGAGAPDSRLVTTDRRAWTSLERPGRLLQRRSDGINMTPTDVLGPLGGYHVGNERLSRVKLLAFPTDPEAIIARLRDGYVAGQGGSLYAELYVQIGDALREQPAPPALRAGFYGALARIPGVVLLGAVTDRAGRTGQAVARTSDGVRHELVLDPGSSELLAERETLLDPRAAGVTLPAGTLITDTSYLDRRVMQGTDHVP